MTNRECFFNLLKGAATDRVPFFPDITTWYTYTRMKLGEEEAFQPGEYIPDGLEFHKRESRLPEQFGKMTFLDYYREYDWGLPVHMYHWYNTVYSGGVEETVQKSNGVKTITLKTPRGDLQRCYKLANDGSWAPAEYYVKKAEDLEIVKYVVEHTEIIPLFDCVTRFHKETAGFGVCDLVIGRSPFGKLVHELMGFENVIYMLYDDPKIISDFLEFQEYHDLKIIELASGSPAELIIISDHADENLISPVFYKNYCIPFYQKACEILHKKSKFVSTHLDGNFKGFFNLLDKTGFDLLDGCTPAPMFNYEVEELAAAVDGKLKCYCGIPSSLLTQHLPTGQIVDFGVRIAKAFDKKVIINIGDILSPTGSIEQVIEAGKAVMGL